MADKRGTGAEYGQEILRERSAEAGAPEPSKKVSKKTVLSVVVATIIAGGAMTAVILTSDKTPAEKVEALSVDISNDGVALTDKVKEDIQNSGSQAVGSSLPVSEAVTTESENTPETPALEIAQPQKISSPETESPDETVPAATAAPSTEVIPAEEVVKEAQSAAEVSSNDREFDPAKFGLPEDKAQGAEVVPEQVDNVKPAAVATTAPTAPSSTIAAPASVVVPAPVPVPDPVRLERVELPATNSFAQNQVVTGSDLNYTGSALKVEYKAQQQDTIYLYNTFAAKIFLLPTDKGDDISAYLSDEKGWQLKLLPGGILRVQRSENKASWSQATDLFIVAGKRTYSLILQGVGEPSQRTDSLRYTSADTEQKPKSKK